MPGETDAEPPSLDKKSFLFSRRPRPLPVFLFAVTDRFQPPENTNNQPIKL
jgi:hypothetical protein